MIIISEWCNYAKYLLTPGFVYGSGRLAGGLQLHVIITLHQFRAQVMSDRWFPYIHSYSGHYKTPYDEHVTTLPAIPDHGSRGPAW